jgi:hypothetical protein
MVAILYLPSSILIITSAPHWRGMEDLCKT